MKMRAFDNLKVGAKLIAGFLIVSVIVIVVAVVGYWNMKSIDGGMTDMYFNQTLPIDQLGIVSSKIYQVNGNVYKTILLPEERTLQEQSIAEDIATIDEQLKLYRESHLLQEEEERLQ